MLRALQVLAIAATIASAFWVYRQSYDTRHLSAEVTAAERRVERLKSDIAVLEAERAYLARPERIEPLARMQGLRPPTPDQIQPLSTTAGATKP
jgi:cell division protein FtsL